MLLVKVSDTHAGPDGDLTKRTIRVWEPRFGCELTEEDARRVTHNVIGFFEVLAEWRNAEATSPISIATKSPAEEVRKAQPPIRLDSF